MEGFDTYTEYFYQKLEFQGLVLDVHFVIVLKVVRFFFNLEISNINTYNANWQLVFIYVHVQKKKKKKWPRHSRCNHSYLKVICFLTLSSALVALPVGDDANVRMWTRSLKFGKWFKKHLGVEYNIRLVCR